ncbi:TonB-dependent receptor plug domain-containing protein [Erythrobacter aureus]|uniref:TonB-dependent receptor n=1 Tax=Erythrobacter aureus TaxID=2182384 RepID=A0A345YBL5_9SPHN|nr:TonB-dependent receptor [Erythrobacter aureus]AXK41317.1 TonB-dependent receptor [Erythrobacter aureus]
MLFRFRALPALFAGSALIAIASPLHAQDRDSDTGQPAQGETSQDEDNTIVVTGTRIRGARVIGEVATLDREAIVEAGQIDLGEAIRVLPQNFSGGQNPGVGSGAGLVNQNVNSASSANLRGLGPDATLTLLNGHRLPYNAAFQAVDISAIPLAAVDRLEVMPDGASALYGSDAVGGVVNVILRRDFEGVTTSAQIGASTDGGNFRQQFDIVGGTLWDGGGVMLAYDFANNSAIEARQRDYTSSLIEETTLYPEIRRHAVTLSAHHDLAPGIEASVDAVYSNRSSQRASGTETLLTRRAPKVEGFAIAPSLRFDVGGGWQARIEGVYGRDRTLLNATFTPASGNATMSDGRFLNELTAIEAGLEGPLFALPGGNTRLAVGGGIRNNRLDYALDDGLFDVAFDVEREAKFGYAELYLPLVSSANAIAGISQLTVSAAVRYEDYSGLDELATPRIGLTFAPVDGFTLRGSWSRSFKAPTLFQQFTFYEAILLPAAPFGAGSAGDTLLFTAGGNPEVGPERAHSRFGLPRGERLKKIQAGFADICSMRKSGR